MGQAWQPSASREQGPLRELWGSRGLAQACDPLWGSSQTGHLKQKGRAGRTPACGVPSWSLRRLEAQHPLPHTKTN